MTDARRNALPPRRYSLRHPHPDLPPMLSTSSSSARVSGAPAALEASWRHRAWYVVALLWSALAVPAVGGLYWLTHLFDPSPGHYRRWSKRFGRAVLWGAGVRVVREGEAGLPEARPCVFVANHQSAFDIPALALALRRPFGFVAKAELARVPILGAAIRNSLSVFVERGDPRRAIASLRAAGERIRGGNSVLVFAEGQRSYGAAMRPFKRGAFLLAVEAGVPIVPVAVRDAYAVLDESRGLARRGTIHVAVGAPIETAGLSRRDLPVLMSRTRAALAHLVEGGAPG